MTRLNKRFITHSTGSEGTGSKVSQLITQFIVPSKDKTAKRASKAMLHSEWVATTITVRGEIWGRFSIAKIEGITKFLGREFSAMVEGRHTGGKPGDHR